ncbi:MAG: conjugative transposon protein TraN [Williamsia sp.]|nr:conjugative transposon protein TraN [Williamsia sp.]
MKQLLFATLLSCICLNSTAQSSLCLSTDKTTSLLFPFAIKHVDRGTASVLAQQVKDVPNLLLVKAGAKGFSETNLSVATEDGSIYCFTVCYDPNPTSTSFHLPIQNRASMETYANGILDNPKTVKGLHSSKWNIRLEVLGIYIKNDVMYLQLGLENDSPLDYEVEWLRFFIADQKQSKRTAAQEVDIQPLYTAGNVSVVKGMEKSVAVIALQKFTIPDAKYFGLQVREKNGGRHLLLKLGNRKLMQATLLPDLK